MNYYVNIKHPITGGTVQAVATGKRRQQGENIEAEVVVITPKSNLGKIWIQRGDLFGEE